MVPHLVVEVVIVAATVTVTVTMTVTVTVTVIVTPCLAVVEGCRRLRSPRTAEAALAVVLVVLAA